MSDGCGRMLHVSTGDDVTSILEQICLENLAVYRESPARLQEDVSQGSQVAHDYRGRLVYELLQNADDALLGAGAGDDQVIFRLTDRTGVGRGGRLRGLGCHSR